MTLAKALFAAAVSMALSSAGPATADSLASAASSGSIGVSVGTISGSFGRSSDRSSKTAPAAPTANGDYKIIDLAAAPERQRTVRLTLQAVTDAGADNEFFLYLPQVVAEQARLTLGGIVTARPRPYGTEFAQAVRGETKQAFYLVLADDWYRELPAKAVQL